MYDPEKDYQLMFARLKIFVKEKYNKLRTSKGNKLVKFEHQQFDEWKNKAISLYDTVNMLSVRYIYNGFVWR